MELYSWRTVRCLLLFATLAAAWAAPASSALATTHSVKWHKRAGGDSGTERRADTRLQELAHQLALNSLTRDHDLRLWKEPDLGSTAGPLEDLHVDTGETAGHEQGQEEQAAVGDPQAEQEPEPVPEPAPPPDLTYTETDELHAQYEYDFREVRTLLCQPGTGA